jgi:c-di-GMP-binding flagellar brake protein YcgR
VRWPVQQPIVGHALPIDQPVTLHDISAGGFSVLAAVNLTLGGAYTFRFALQPHPVVVTARLAYAVRVSGSQETPAYLLGFEFTEAQRDEAAITSLVAEATRASR